MNPAVMTAAVAVALSAGSLGISAFSTGAARQIPAGCHDDNAIVGTSGDDKLKGTTSDDVIFGGGGDDVIKGKGGNDLICARGGDDLVKGGTGDDTIYGGGADDELRGGPGDDTIKGGPGTDSANGGADTDDCDAESETNCEEATPSPSPSATATATPTATPTSTPATSTPTPSPPPVNAAPTAVNDSYTTAEDGTLNVGAPGVLGNDTDSENEALTATAQTFPANGTLTLSASGALTYVPNANFNGADTFTYTARDSSVTSAPATVTITVTPTADAPVAVAQSVSTDEDTAKVVTLTGTDIDGPAPTVFKITSLASDGDLRAGSGVGGQLITAGDLPFTLPGNEVTYVPDVNFNGLDDFDFKANDGALDSPAASVSVNVLAVNDPPTNIGLSQNAVDEEKPAGSTVGVFAASDVDAGETFSFSLTPGAGDADNARFTIDNGVLKTTEVFDFETQGPFSIRVKVLDAAGAPFEKQFAITLNNVNDTPVVADQTYSLPENSANNTAVGTPTVNDQDAGQTHTWSITGGNSDTAFAIDASTGAITVANSSALDFEDVQQWVLTVRAEDNGSPVKSDTGAVTIDLTNVNEAPTDITLSNASVAENQSAGTIVGNLGPVDPDASDTHTLSLVSGTGDGDNGKFQIDNGVLKTAQSFDFETQGPFSIRVRARDAGNLDYEEVFSISVTNVNDAPVASPATVSLDENSANGTAVHTVSATDEDTPGQTLSYSITGGDPLGAFQINQNTGAITVADKNDLDFETNPTFALTVKVEDNGSPIKDDSETITINLNNLNEAPVVNAASLSLAENSPNGTSVGTPTFTDQDGGQSHTFALLAGGNTGGAFQINPSTGEITVADANDVDFETNHPFNLTVEVTDNGSPNLTGSNTVTVNLTNVNEAPTDISLSDNTAPENAAINTVTGVLSGTDPDAGDSPALTFSFASGTGDADNARFNINPANNQLRASEVFDYESQGPFSVRIRATDGGTLFYEEAFQVLIEDLNDFPSVDPATFAIDENSANGTAVGTVTSSDEDAGQTRSYSITGGDPLGAFQINSSTGAITVADKNDLDFETNPSFALTVQVTDDGSPALSDSQAITVNLNDVNDNPVVNAATLSLAEDSANGASAGTATATDQDSPAQTFTWAITAGNAGGTFAINPSTGQITVADASGLDFETTPSYGLTVEATDNGTPNRSGSNTVTVNLTNVNEKPAITAPATISAQYGVAKGLSGISVSDPDSGNNDISMTLAVLDGTLDVDTTVLNGLVAGDVTDDGTDAVVLTGKQSEINNTLGALNGVTYTSDAGFLGLSDTVAITTNDAGNTGSGGTKVDAANVTIQFNTPPAATDQTVTTNEDTEKTVTLAGTDADADPLTFKITALPAAGKLHEGTSSAGTEITAGALPYTLPADKVTYVPPLNQNGLSLETFGFKANDGSTDSAAGVVTVDVTAVDDLSVAVNDAFSVAEDSGASALQVRTNDTDVDGAVELIASVTQPANGTVAKHSGDTQVQYTPTANYCNNPPTIPVDTFTYTLVGGGVGTVNVTVTCVDDLPVGVADSKTMDEDSTSAAATTINVLSNDTDIDGGPKTIISKTNGTHGTVTITNSGADLKYVPNANYCNTQPGGNPDTFTYDLNGGSGATVSVTVTCIDDAPVAVNDSATVLEDANATQIDVLANDTDIDDGPKFIDVKSNSTNAGTVTITNAGANLTYEPADNYCNDPELQPAGGNLVETFTYTLNGTPASVGTVTMTVTCVNDPPTADTESFNGPDSALSNFRLDNGTSTAGLDIAPTTLHNVLAGDVDIEGDTVSLVAGADCTGTGPFTCLTDGYDPDGIGGQPVEHGTVLLETDGDFHYTPPPGHVGSDSFDYRVSDGQAQNAEANGTVNINVAGPTTWFVNDDASAGGNGTSASPFQTFAPLTAAGASNHLDDANDSIFVYEGTYNSGIVLEDGQKLLGRPHSLDINDMAGRTHTDLVTGAGTPPAISHGGQTVVTLGSGNELQDLALGNGTITLAGTSVGTATVKDSSINTTGKALDINGGTLDMTFTNVSSSNSGSEAIKLNNAAGSFSAAAGALQNANATNAVVDINGASQTFTYDGTIADSGGEVVSITNTIGGTKEFNGTISGGGTGSDPRINLATNPGSVIRFTKDLTLNTAGSPAFSATGGGTIHVTSDDNLINSGAGTALKVVNTTIGDGDLIFDTISASNAPNGIVLDNTGTSGNLSVTGTGAASSGGTIANAQGTDASTVQCAAPSGAPAGVGIFLRNTSGPSLHSMTLNGSDNFGILGYDVTGFNMTSTTLNGTHGNNENQDEGSATFCGLLGSANITDSVVGGGYEDSLHVVNSNDNLNRLTVSSTDFATSNSIFAGDAFNATSGGSGTFNVTVNNGSTFTTARGDLFQFTPEGTATADLVLDGNAFSNNHTSIVGGGGGITVNPGGGSSNVNVTYSISNNSFQGAKGSAIVLKTGGINSSGTFNGSVTNNQIGSTSVANSGSADGIGLALTHTGNGTSKFVVTGNTIRRYRTGGIRFVTNDGDPNVRLTIQSNTIVEPRNEVGARARYGVSIDAGGQLSDDVTMCLDLGGLGGAMNSLSNGDADPVDGGGHMDINVVPNGNTTITMPGYAGGADDLNAVKAYLAARNAGDGVPVVFADTSFEGNSTYNGALVSNCL